MARILACAGFARLGGRGKDIKELAIFSLCTLAGRVLFGRVGGAVSETLKLEFDGQAQFSVLSADGGSVVGSCGGSSSTVAFFESLLSLLRLLMSDNRSDTSLLSWQLSLVSNLRIWVS